MLDLSDNYRAYDKGVSRNDEICQDIECIYHGVKAADLYRNGKFVGNKTLDEAIDFATAENDLSIIWTINDEEE